MEVRVHVEQGVTQAVRLPADATWGGLRDALRAQTGFAGTVAQCALDGAPVDVLDDDVPLSASGISDGSSLSVSLIPDDSQSKHDLVVVEIEDDNHCLFRAVSYALCGGDRTAEGAQALRALAGALVLSDPVRWTSAVLAMAPAEYARKISSTAAWGGAVELALFAEHFGAGIVAVDAAANGQTYAFGPEDAPCALLLYTGIHYDVVVRPGPRPQTLFGPAERREAVQQAVALAQAAHAQRRYTDTARFALRCGACGARLLGERDATRHARQTGHVSFEECAAPGV